LWVGASGRWVGVVGFKKKIEKEFPRKNNVEEKKIKLC